MGAEKTERYDSNQWSWELTTHVSITPVEGISPTVIPHQHYNLVPLFGKWMVSLCSLLPVTGGAW